METINWSELSYLLKSQLILSASAWVYFAFVRKERFFILNRVFLLGSLLLSLIIPFYSFTQPVSIAEVWILPEVVVNEGVSPAVQESFDWIMFIYLLIVFFMGCRLIYGFIKWLLKPSDANISPHTFFRWIYVPEDHVSREVFLQHEQVHARHLHSLDTVFVALYRVVFWINPIVHLYAKWISENHEYTADAIAAKSVGRKRYAEILVGETFSLPGFNLTDSFYKPSLTKNRIAMLFKNNSPRRNRLKYLLIFPLIAAVMFIPACSENEIVEKPINRSESVQDQNGSNTLGFMEAELAPATVDCLDKMGEERQSCFMTAVSNHIIENFKYPDEARDAGVEARIFVGFVVSDLGKVERVTVKSSTLLGPDDDSVLDEASQPEMLSKLELLERSAVEVVASLPDFIPAQKDGKDVSVKLVVPIAYRINH